MTRIAQIMFCAMAALTLGRGVAAAQYIGLSGPDQASGDYRTFTGAGVPVTRFGAKCDGVTDDSAAFQAAINSLPNGGTIIIPPSRCAIASQVTISGNGIKLIGFSGVMGQHDVGYYRQSSALVWTGARGGTMLKVGPVPGPANQRNNGITIKDLTFYGTNAAGVGLQVLSEKYGRFENLSCIEATIACFDLGTVPVLGETRSNCQNTYINIQANILQSAGVGLRLNGDNTGNIESDVCLSVFLDTQFIMSDGDGIQINWGDNNTFIQTFIYHASGGTADALSFKGVSTGYAQTNHFYGVSVGNKDTKGGNIHAYAPSAGNTIQNLDSASASPTPIIDNGATLCYAWDNYIQKGQNCPETLLGTKSLNDAAEAVRQSIPGK